MKNILGLNSDNHLLIDQGLALEKNEQRERTLWSNFKHLRQHIELNKRCLD